MHFPRQSSALLFYNKQHNIAANNYIVLQHRNIMYGFDNEPLQHGFLGCIIRFNNSKSLHNFVYGYHTSAAHCQIHRYFYLTLIFAKFCIFVLHYTSTTCPIKSFKFSPVIVYKIILTSSHEGLGFTFLSTSFYGF